jgi:hypothetical protein
VAAIGLLCVGLALVLRKNPAEKVSLRIIVEYYAALLFFLAVSITHNGVWGERQDRTLVPHDDWLRRSVKETARAYGLAILCAWVLGTIGRSLGDIVEAIPYVIVWGGLGLFILAGVLDQMEKAERRYRRRRSRQSRPRSNYLTAVAHTKARYAGRWASCGHPFRAGMRIGRVPEVGWPEVERYRAWRGRISGDRASSGGGERSVPALPRPPAQAVAPSSSGSGPPRRGWSALARRSLSRRRGS